MYPTGPFKPPHPHSVKYTGHSDWRLPNIKELRSLVYHDFTNTADVINPAFFDTLQTAHSCWYSTTYRGSKVNAWSLDLMYGDSSRGGI
jgi:hypothetical protein